jgi:hypothetical protein
VLAWSRDLQERSDLRSVKKFVVSGTLHYTWDDTMAIIFEFRRVRPRGKMQFGDEIFYSIELRCNRGE